MPNLYLVERTDHVGYDEYESMIVVADDLVSALAVTKVMDHDDRSVRLSTRSTKDVPFWTSYPRSAASEEINHSIVEVSVISNQTAEAMGKASKSVEDLAIQSRTLSDLIIKLKSH